MTIVHAYILLINLLQMNQNHVAIGPSRFRKGRSFLFFNVIANSNALSWQSNPSFDQLNCRLIMVVVILITIVNQAYVTGARKIFFSGQYCIANVFSSILVMTAVEQTIHFSTDVLVFLCPLQCTLEFLLGYNCSYVYEFESHIANEARVMMLPC